MSRPASWAPESQTTRFPTCAVRIPFQSTSLSRAWTLLTGHIGQTLLSIFLFYGFGFALFGRLERYELALLSLGVGLLLIIFSRVWLTRFRLGPMEWV